MKRRDCCSDTRAWSNNARLKIFPSAARLGFTRRSLVAHVTDDKRLPKDRRKRLQVEHAPHLPPRAQMLKMADKISNLAALLASPPAGWSAQRRIDYFEWAREVVDGCRSAHAGLAGLFDELYDRREETSR